MKRFVVKKECIFCGFRNGVLVHCTSTGLNAHLKCLRLSLSDTKYHNKIHLANKMAYLLVERNEKYIIS
jgi:hypothetical protein